MISSVLVISVYIEQTFIYYVHTELIAQDAS